jgi:hypothetical protein
MFDELQEPFRQLARTIHSVEAWTQSMLEVKTLSTRDRALIEKLQKYVNSCRKRPENWSNRASAIRVTQKLDNLWSTLLVNVIMSDRNNR